jgi:hypothetical protein
LGQRPRSWSATCRQVWCAASASGCKKACRMDEALSAEADGDPDNPESGEKRSDIEA